MEHDGCVGCKYEMCDLDSKECSGCKQNAEDKYTRMTNKESIFRQFEDDDYKLAKALIETSIINDGDYSYDGEDEYWVDNYVEQYKSPNGCVYADDDYDECLRETVEWLNRKVER